MKVGLFVNGWNGENIDTFIDGFNSFFTKGESDLFVFTSYSQIGTSGSMEMSNVENSIYSLSDVSFFDAVIILQGISMSCSSPLHRSMYCPWCCERGRKACPLAEV